MNKIKAVIFDLDGTLADTVESIRAALNSALRSRGFPEIGHDRAVAAIGNGARELIRLSLPGEAGQDDDTVREVQERFRLEYAGTYADGVTLYPGVAGAVAALRKEGLRLAVLSNKPDRFVRELIALLFPGGEIEYAAGQREGLPMKPDPTVPLMLARRLGVRADECAFVGDSDVDMKTAKNAGMLAVGCLWGYRGERVLREAGADVITGDADKLAQIITERRAL